MTNNRFDLVQALRATALNIEKSQSYQWGHMGLCNCGFLAQQITSQSKEEIHSKAMAGRGDWSEQLNDYCPTSGLPMDSLIDELVFFGFTVDELKHLERLSDPKVLHEIPIERRHVRHNVKADVILYLNTWAEVLERSLLPSIHIEELEPDSTLKVHEPVI